jgi:amidase
LGDELSLLDAVGQAELVQRGEVSPAQLVDAAIARTERVNGTINAVVTEMFDKARATASGPLAGGPLRGVPIVLKDHLTATAGDPMYEGMRFLRNLGWTEARDSHVARRLRDAGMILLGKTNLPELAIITTTESEAYGPCRNPWDLRRSVGGSSGGSAAAVAAGIVPVAHGTDAGGSIRIPASFCGIVGLKPSRGRTSQGPDHGDMWGNGSWHVLGLTRSVRDTAALLDVMSGPAPGDPVRAPPPARPYYREVGVDPGRLRIGFMARAPKAHPEIHPECRIAVEATAGLLESLGHDVEASFPDAFDHMTEGSVDAFFGMAGSGVAWNLDRWSRLTGKSIGPDDVEPYTWAFADMGRRCSGPVFLEGLAEVQATARRLASWWDDGFDLLLTPTTSTPAFERGYLAAPPDDPLAPLYRAAAIMPYTGAYNFTGQPAVSLPLHWTPEGLPVGVQLGAAYGREDLLLRVAAQLEMACPWAGRTPPVHAGV